MWGALPALLCILLLGPVLLDAAQTKKPLNNAAQTKKPIKKAAVRPTKGKNNMFDKAYLSKRTACMGSGVLQPCIDDQVDAENCVMKCMSTSSYEQVFSEPLEEGEVAFEKTNKFKRIFKEELKKRHRRGETL
mmetsp:Transcript_9297/g.16432  ORF Transcript_9297/g.16432 Transcript_9297/m.16432 type:complete len:133 (+) Transcript_9297:99-497(+)|eukprot:CAMPEP_0119106774 /NCGR_PEP_ID=MMETSP1180-20130426/6313_1 /TAXON_ID=3052 ORGANISM="Chlamydomonas cf sp, Strain CCMP681" /NCGR_SAMPLE_ID=MMETSP1180 /ASSEMBLY_ACC=CAM_ASM_000741 /LENGTH=132 /DNA_ID=CAMNT_0007092161 /DNA_START=81 /DNA_END=479 /DNA_ORIENTATION=-